MIGFTCRAQGSLAQVLGRIVVVMAVALCGSVLRAEAYFIALNSSASAAATVEIAPPAGGLYSAAARNDTGTVWNQLPNVVPTLTPADNIGNPATNSATGVYQLYPAPKALVNSLGGASAATINVAVNYVGNTANGFSTVAQTGTAPSALFGNVWRLTSGSNSLTYTIANLPAADTAYDLYLYAAGASTSQQRGVTVALAADNIPAGGAASVTTSGVSSSASSDITLFDSGGGLINQGVTWNVIRARSDSARKIVFTQSKHPSGQNWCSGFQIVPVSAPPSREIWLEAGHGMATTDAGATGTS